ncbi:unnamed protein product [Aphanomyces euteiches]
MDIQEHGVMRPCVQMTLQLMTTYRRINMAYYKSKRTKTSPKALALSKIKPIVWDDEDEDKPVKKVNNIMADHYIPVENEILKGRYRITGTKLGMGSFGQVLEAYDQEAGTGVAIKIIKKQPHLALQAQTEIKILEYMHTNPSADRCHILKLLDKFNHSDHECLVFPLCSFNLYDLQRSLQSKSIGLKLIRKMAKQIIESLGFLGDVGVIHCDLKPENIVLIRSNHSNIKVIDFGSSCQSDKRVYSYIQSRFYRAPEVLLGMKYTTAIDMWSLGCILVELHTGMPLFAGQDLHDQLRKIVQVLGMIPNGVLDKANAVLRSKYFERVVENGQYTRRYRLKTTSATELEALSLADRSLRSICLMDGRRLNSDTDHTQEDYDLFVDLVQRMLEIDPMRRITPLAALSHPFLQSDRQQRVPPTTIYADKKRTTVVERSSTHTSSIREEDAKHEDPHQVYLHRAKHRRLQPRHDE